MFFKKKEAKIYSGKIGGIPFFITILCLTIFDIACTLKILAYFDAEAWQQVGIFFAAAGAGAWISYLFFPGKLNVLIHEFKHSFVSSIVGNKAKDLKITSRDSGHFQYEFTKHTAKFNALISLAPYYLPLFSFPIFAISFGLIFKDVLLSPIILAFAFGADSLLNIRDIGSHQTDFSSITGGFLVGLYFVLSINLAILLIYLSWSTFQLEGLLELLYGIGEFLLLFIKKDIELL